MPFGMKNSPATVQRLTNTIIAGIEHCETYIGDAIIYNDVWNHHQVEAISDFPVPTCKRQLMRFLGMAGYYRKFCNNFSVIAEPLTNLLSKRMRLKWTSDCQNVFDKLKAILRSEPVLLAPNFNKEFKLAVDASDVGAGGVLLQEDDSGVDHPVCYFSKKFN